MGAKNSTTGNAESSPVPISSSVSSHRQPVRSPIPAPWPADARSSTSTSELFLKVKQSLNDKHFLHIGNVSPSEKELNEILNLLLTEAKTNPLFCADFCVYFCKQLHVLNDGTKFKDLLRGKCLLECERRLDDEIQNHIHELLSTRTGYESYSLKQYKDDVTRKVKTQFLATLRFISESVISNLLPQDTLIEVIHKLPQSDPVFYIECNCCLLELSRVASPLDALTTQKLASHLQKLHKLSADLSLDQELKRSLEFLLKRDPSVTTSSPPCTSRTPEEQATEEERNLAEKNEDNLSVSQETSVIEHVQPLPKYDYKKDQWSPLNPEGKTQYDSAFLLTMQSQPMSLRKPEGLPYSDVIKDTPIQHKLPAINRPAMASIPMHEHSDVFMPLYMRQGTSSSVSTLLEDQADFLPSETKVLTAAVPVNDCALFDTIATCSDMLQSQREAILEMPFKPVVEPTKEKELFPTERNDVPVNDVKDSDCSEEALISSPSDHRVENEEIFSHQTVAATSGEASHLETSLPVDDGNDKSELCPKSTLHDDFELKELLPVYNICNKNIVSLSKANERMSLIPENALHKCLIVMSMINMFIHRFVFANAPDLEGFCKMLTPNELKILDLYGTGTSSKKMTALISGFPKIFELRNGKILLCPDGHKWAYMHMESILVTVLQDTVRNRTVTLSVMWANLRDEFSVTYLPDKVVLTPLTLRKFIEKNCKNIVIAHDGALHCTKLQSEENLTVAKKECDKLPETGNKGSSSSNQSSCDLELVDRNNFHVDSCIGKVIYVTSKLAFIWWFVSLNHPAKISFLVSDTKYMLSASRKKKPKLGDIVSFSARLITSQGGWFWTIFNVQKENPNTAVDDSCLRKSRVTEMIKNLMTKNVTTVLWDSVGIVVDIGEGQGTIWCPTAADFPFALFVQVMKKSVWVVGEDSHDLKKSLAVGDVVLCDVELSKANSGRLKWLTKRVRKYTKISQKEINEKSLELRVFEETLSGKNILSYFKETAVKSVLDKQVELGLNKYWNQERRIVEGNVIWNTKGIIVQKNVVEVATKFGTITTQVPEDCWNPNGINISQISQKVVVCAQYTCTLSPPMWIVHFVNSPTKETFPLLLQTKCLPSTSASPQKKEVSENAYQASCIGEVLHVGNKNATIWCFYSNSRQVSILVNASATSLRNNPESSAMDIGSLNVGDQVAFIAELVTEGGLLRWQLKEVVTTGKVLAVSPNFLFVRSNVSRIVTDMAVSKQRTIFWDCYCIVHVGKNSSTVWCPAVEELPCDLLFQVNTSNKIWITDGRTSSKTFKNGEIVVCHIETTISRTGLFGWFPRFVGKLEIEQAISGDITPLVYHATFAGNKGLWYIIQDARKYGACIWSRNEVFCSALMFNVVGELMNGSSIEITRKDNVKVTAQVPNYCWNPDNISLTETSQKVLVSAERAKNSAQWVVRLIRKLQIDCTTSSGTLGPVVARQENTLEGKSPTPPHEDLKTGCAATIDVKGDSTLEFSERLCFGRVLHVTKTNLVIWWFSCNNFKEVNILVHCDVSSVQKDNISEPKSLEIGFHVGDTVNFYSKLTTKGGLSFWMLWGVTVVKGSIGLVEQCSIPAHIYDVIDVILCSRSTIYWNCYGIVGSVETNFATIWCPANNDVPHDLLVDVHMGSKLSWVVRDSSSPSTLAVGDVVECDVQDMYTKSSELKWLAKCVRKLNIPSLEVLDCVQLISDVTVNKSNILNKTIEDVRHQQKSPPRTGFWAGNEQVLQDTIMMNVTGDLLDPGHVELTTEDGTKITAHVPTYCWNPDEVDLSVTLQKVTTYVELDDSCDDLKWIVRCIRKPKEHCPSKVSAMLSLHEPSLRSQIVTPAVASASSESSVNVSPSALQLNEAELELIKPMLSENVKQQVSSNSESEVEGNLDDSCKSDSENKRNAECQTISTGPIFSLSLLTE